MDHDEIHVIDVLIGLGLLDGFDRVKRGKKRAKELEEIIWRVRERRRHMEGVERLMLDDVAAVDEALARVEAAKGTPGYVDAMSKLVEVSKRLDHWVARWPEEKTAEIRLVEAEIEEKARRVVEAGEAQGLIVEPLVPLAAAAV